MPVRSLAQRTVFEDPSPIALRLPYGRSIAALHPRGSFPLVEDPRTTSRACIIGMMVLRPATTSWTPDFAAGDVPRELRGTGDWCYDVRGVGGSWPISGGNAFDAYRLAMQYGTVDAVLAGSSTVIREGRHVGARRAHLWQPYTPLSWSALAPYRGMLEPAISDLRRRWQDLGLLSRRSYPAQVAVTGSGVAEDPNADILDARIFHERHPDGPAIEAWILTSEAGAVRLRERARRRRRRDIDRIVLVGSSPESPETIDVARVPELLRTRLDARLVEHDGGATSLSAFLEAGAIAQLNLTLMRRRSVREVLAAGGRIGDEQRKAVLQSWSDRPRLFPPGGGALPQSWRPFYAVAEEGEGAEGVAVSFDVRGQ